MGICKCKKRTELFCFVHRKAVCETCIYSPEHRNCVVKTYVEWLTDSEYDTPSCGICKGELHPDQNTLRLMCLHMFHPDCLDAHCASLPPHTAKAGYLCPTCTKPIFPPDDETTLAKSINEHLSKAPWASTLLTGKINNPPELFESGSVSTPSFASQSSSSSSSTTTTVSNDMQSSNIASRKPGAREQTILIDDEPEEDKYKKRSVMQLFTALGIVQPPKTMKGRQTRIRFDKRRIMVLFALITCLITVIYLGMSLTSDIEIKEENNTLPS